MADILAEKLSGIFITDQLELRPAPRPNYLREKLAIQDLARDMAERPVEVLPRLVSLGLEICEAQSAGISLLEGDNFRWFGLQGTLKVFEGEFTPRNDSPCGVCLDTLKPTLMQNPERVYDWIRNAGIVVPEVLLVPLTVSSDALGTLWIVADEGRKFDREHSRVLSELAAFAGIALQMIRSEEKLQKALLFQETLTKEMGHRVKNVFAIADGLIRTTARASESKEQLAQSLSGRLHALADAHAMVRRSFNPNFESEGVVLEEIIRRITSPYSLVTIEGDFLKLGERSTNNVALVLHELATNSAKYGALSEHGRVHVKWTVGDDLQIIWTEHGGPPVSPPSKSGFGSILVKTSLSAHSGRIEYEWKSEGLVATITAPVEQLSQ